MFSTDFWIYIGQGKYGRYDHPTRLAKTIQFVKDTLGGKVHGKLIDKEEPFEELFRKLTEVSSKRNHDLTLVVFTIDEIKVEHVVELLVKHSFTVIVVEELWGKDTSDVKNSVKRNQKVIYGDILRHTVDVLARLTSYLNALHDPYNNLINEQRTQAGRDEAKYLWKTIKHISRVHRITTQQGLVDQLRRDGVTTREGKPITQSYISRFFKNSGLKVNWERLKGDIKQKIKAKAQAKPAITHKSP